MLVFNRTADPVMLAKEKSTIMMLGGEPLGERFIWWNFVSSHKGKNRTGQGRLERRKNHSATNR
jgi:redox-sensitive bicupin YhaK (pirin superfamily)